MLNKTVIKVVSNAGRCSSFVSYYAYVCGILSFHVESQNVLVLEFKYLVSQVMSEIAHVAKCIEQTCYLKS